MICRSFAKINLGLFVLGKRRDGYHEIETIFQLINLYDEIQIEFFDKEIDIRCDPPVCPDKENNLAYRAARLLQTDAGQGCKIVLKKNIPVGAGLGGGSSNGATILMALNKLWELNLSEQELIQYAGQLGSDVPFFILGGTAIGTGRGEKLKSLFQSLHYWGVLLTPDFRISSAWAYQTSNFNLTKSIKKSKLTDFTRNFDRIEMWQDILKNDLEAVVFQKYPVCESIVQKLLESGAFFARMSGSGSSLFGLYNTYEAAQRAFSYFDGRYKTFLFEPLYAKNL